MKPTHHKKTIIKNWIIGIISVFLVLGGIGIIWLATLQIPDLHSFELRAIPKSTQIYDRTGTVLLYDFHGDIKRTEVPSTQMSQYVKDATVAIEDSSFYTNSGFRPLSLLRAAFINLTTGSYAEGGSTITQQIVKNAILTQDKTIIRKIKEIVLALKVDKEFTKDQILEIYLNEAPYGGTIYGVEEAAETYYGIHAADLDLAQSAYLAAIPQSPSRLNPYAGHLDELETRKNLVLTRMHDLGFITDAQYASAKSEVVTWKPQDNTGIKAPHFVFYVKDYLENKYGPDILTQGIKVITTLDYTMQQQAESIVKTAALKDAKTYNASNEALVAIDPKTGQILSMVGSRDYFDTTIDGQFNVATAARQPGSSFKPFVYALGFNDGYTPDTVLFDVPTEFNPGCSPYGYAQAGTPQTSCYMPQNYDGGYRGPITVRSALGQSINIPAVKMLYLVGVQNAIKLATDMGITTLGNASQYGLTLTLGGGAVTLVDMTSAYGVFAAEGVRHPVNSVLEVDDANGNVLEKADPTDPGTQVLPKQSALEISNVLSDNQARQPEFGPHSALVVDGHTVAVKTGTTDDFRDAWIIGYTPSLVVGAWVGNNDNSPMAKKISAVIAAPSWNQFMTAELQGKPDEPFESPAKDPNYDSLKPVLRGIWEGGNSYFIDTISGKLATAQTPEQTKKEFVTPDVHDILYWVDKDNPLGPAPTNPYNDPQYKNWETAVQNWWNAHAGNYSFSNPGPKPTAFDDVHTDTNKPVVTIQSPQDGSTVSATTPLTVTISTTGPYPLAKFDVFWNDAYVGSAPNGNTSFTFIPNSTNNVTATDEIRVVATDSVYNSGEQTITVNTSQ